MAEGQPAHVAVEQIVGQHEDAKDHELNGAIHGEQERHQQKQDGDDDHVKFPEKGDAGIKQGGAAGQKCVHGNDLLQVRLQIRLILDIRRLGKLRRDVALFHAIDPVSQTGNHGQVLFDNDHGHFAPHQFQGF
jgi:hypothetical protein